MVLRGSFDGRPAVAAHRGAPLYDDAEPLRRLRRARTRTSGARCCKRDEPIYDQEVVEIFLDANADGRTYNELQVSPHNVIFDAYFPARRQGMDLGWDSGMKTAVKVRGTLDNPADRDEGWRWRCRFPSTGWPRCPTFRPKTGERWRFNLYRLEHVGRQQVEGQAFSPLSSGTSTPCRASGGSSSSSGYEWE